MKTPDYLRILTGSIAGSDAEAQLLRGPDLQWRLPREVLTVWGRTLIQFDTEALCIYGKLRTTPRNGEPEWLAVVPDQEVTMASVDVDDFGPAVEELAKRGYQRIGSIHTHPGGGIPTCSGTDMKELWDGFGGLHLIISRSGGVAYYYSVDGVSWKLNSRDQEKSPWVMEDLWDSTPEHGRVTCETMLTEKGGHRISQMIGKKTFTTTTYVGTKKSDRSVWPSERVKEQRAIVPTSFYDIEREAFVYNVQGEEYLWDEDLQDLVPVPQKTAATTTTQPTLPALSGEEETQEVQEIVEEARSKQAGDDLGPNFERVDSVLGIVKKMKDHAITAPEKLQIGVVIDDVKDLVTAFHALEKTMKRFSRVAKTPLTRHGAEALTDKMFYMELDIKGLDTYR
jgi:hypothetical protein